MILREGHTRIVHPLDVAKLRALGVIVRPNPERTGVELECDAAPDDGDD